MMSVRAKLQAKLKMTTAGSSGCLICQTFYKLNCQKQIVNLCLLGKCVNNYSVKPLMSIRADTQNMAIF